MDRLTYLHLPPGSSPPELSSPHFRAVLVIKDAVTDAWRDHISAWLVRSGCRYMMAWGDECSKWDDSVDHASLARYDYGEIPEEYAIMTTWHACEQLSEVFWFAIHCAEPMEPTLSCDLIIDIGTFDRHDELLRAFRGQA
jgi:hypothetical protein